MAAALQLSLKDVSKSFGGVKALRGVSLDVPKGIVLGLVGENGAGKSTLMNIIGGVHRPDAGEILVGGEPYRPGGPRDAARAKIGFIHQELNLFTNLSIAENLFIDGMPRRLGLFTDAARAKREARALLDRLQLDADPDTPVESLSPGERQIVEIAKALHRNSELIIFDEPTTSLTARETERLFEVIRDLRASGRTVIYISHILRDVLTLSDRIAVLRDGALVAEDAAGNFDIGRMIHSMIGRDLQGLFPPKAGRAAGPPILEIEGLTQPGVLRNVSLAVRAGEIVGLFGLLGAGRSELARIVFGLDAFARGSIRLNGVDLGGAARGRLRRAIDAGLAFVTENRREEGLLMEASIADNLSLVSLRQLARAGGLIDGAAIESVVRTASAGMRIKAADFRRQPVRSLSGGNQQKVVIGKWLINRPRLFILDEPTRGVDVGSKYEIYAIAQELAAAGSGVLFISSEMEELVGTCDRILVMARGELRGTFESDPFSTEAMLRAAFGEEAERAA